MGIRPLSIPSAPFRGKCFLSSKAIERHCHSLDKKHPFLSCHWANSLHCYWVCCFGLNSCKCYLVCLPQRFMQHSPYSLRGTRAEKAHEYYTFPAENQPFGQELSYAFCPFQPAIRPSTSHRSSQLLAPGQRNTCPFTLRSLRSMPRNTCISSRVSGSSTTARRLDKYCARLTENGIGTCPRCTAYFRQISAGCTPCRTAISTSSGMVRSLTSSGVRSRSGLEGEPSGQ